MAVFSPTLENIQRLKVKPTPGEWELLTFLNDHLDNSFEVFFNPYLDGDRPDIIILNKQCAVSIIEVKDWNLDNFKINKNNKWKVSDGVNSAIKASPQSQVFRYKQNLYNLHLPIVGLRVLTNPNFYNLVHCSVYFHSSTKFSIDSLYNISNEILKSELANLNQDFLSKNINFQQYEKKGDYLNRKQRNLQRDKSISFGNDRLEDLVKKIKNNGKNVLFDENVYQDFKRRLSPPEHTLKQGKEIVFDSKQVSLTQSENCRIKIKGVAGSGKSTVLCKRAINANKRHNSPVLILTFNITLKNYLRDIISDIQNCRDFTAFEISNYHQFFNSQANNTEQDIGELIEKHGIQNLYFKDIFKDQEVIKYQTILLDEIQDYEPAWVKIIMDNFLVDNGEMVLFGDESQNIYQREIVQSKVVNNGFGNWAKLNRSYRTEYDSPLNQLFKDFQFQYLVDKYSDTEIIETEPTQASLGFGILKYQETTIERWKESIYESIQESIQEYNLHPNDIIILSSKVSVVRELNEHWLKNEKTNCMFETIQELAVCTNRTSDELKYLSEHEFEHLVNQNKHEVEKIRRRKKSHFYSNTGLIKLSTTHSFKGLESKTVFYVMSEEDNYEVVYTSITRSTENLIIFDIGGKNKCSIFLKALLR